MGVGEINQPAEHALPGTGPHSVHVSCTVPQPRLMLTPSVCLLQPCLSQKTCHRQDLDLADLTWEWLFSMQIPITKFPSTFSQERENKGLVYVKVTAEDD